MAKLFVGKWTLYKYLYRIRKSLGAHSTFEMLHILRNMSENNAPPTTLRFSPRGKEVFMLIAEGLTGKQIAERLGMSVNGVKRHKEKMLFQNNCTTMLELVAKYHNPHSAHRGGTDTPPMSGQDYSGGNQEAG